LGQGEGGTPGRARYALALKASARKELLALPEALARRVERALDLLQANPLHARAGLDIRPLSGGFGLWRLRVGDLRILYAVDGRSIVVTRIGHRSTVYRG
jgi:addiction module RelE/StbE family toxin